MQDGAHLAIIQDGPLQHPQPRLSTVCKLNRFSQDIREPSGKREVLVLTEFHMQRLVAQPSSIQNSKL